MAEDPALETDTNNAPLAYASPKNDAAESLLGRLHSNVFGRLVMSIALASLVLILKILLIEPRAWYQRARLDTYEYIQRQLTSAKSSNVILVDIKSADEINDQSVAAGGAALSRTWLLSVLRRVAKDHPKAIGVDVDFSGDATNNPITIGDSEFFAECRAISAREGVPIRLGVYRHAADDPGRWLGSPENRTLAAGIGVGNERFQGAMGEMESIKTPVLYMLCWTHVKNGSAPLPSLAYSLAQAGDVRNRTTLPRWSQWVIETNSDYSPDPLLETKGFLVDYSSLNTLLAQRVPAARVPDSTPGIFENKIIILGDVQKSKFSTEQRANEDLFSIPGHSSLYSGALLHGCAAVTLGKAPLFQLTRPGRIVADFASVLAASLWVEGFMWSGFARGRRMLRGAVVHWCVTGIVCLLIIAIALPFVTTVRLAWDDAIFVSLALCLHAGLEQFLVKRLAQAKSHASPHLEGVPDEGIGKTEADIHQP